MGEAADRVLDLSPDLPDFSQKGLGVRVLRVQPRPGLALEELLDRLHVPNVLDQFCVTLGIHLGTNMLQLGTHALLATPEFELCPELYFVIAVFSPLDDAHLFLGLLDGQQLELRRPCFIESAVHSTVIPFRKHHRGLFGNR